MKSLVTKFLTDTISDSELQQLEDWLKKPENRNYFKEMVRINSKLDLTYTPISSKKVSEKLLNAIHVPEKPIRRTYTRVFKYAAVFLLFITISIGVYTLMPSNKGAQESFNTSLTSYITLELENGAIKILNEKTSNEFSDKNGGTSIKQLYNELIYTQLGGIEVETAYHQLTVPYGKRFTVKLADGTVIKMNSGSKLRYPQSFAHLESRTVYLEGEALFSVSKNKNQAFVVHTDQMDIKVFGTKFNVSGYANDTHTSVVLTEGSIGVSIPGTTNKEAYLRIVPGQQIIAENDSFKINEVNVFKHRAWAEGKLLFVDDRFEDIIKKLERHYNVHIESNSPELNNTRYTGTFSTESLTEVLSIFNKITPFNYQMDGNTVKLSF